MIQFTGLTDWSMQYGRSWLLKRSFLIGAGALTLTLPATIYLLGGAKYPDILWIDMILYGVITFLVYPVANMLYWSKTRITAALSSEVCIENGIVTYKSRSLVASAYVEDADKVVDYGEGNHIYFKKSSGQIHCFCDKRNIVTGTLKEFEAVFGAKIVRCKDKKKRK